MEDNKPNNYQYCKIDLVRKQDHVCSLYIFRGFLSEPDPKDDMDEAIEQVVGDVEYSDYIEHFLDNPWCRVVITNIDMLHSEVRDDESGLYSVFTKEVTSQFRIIILFGGDNLLSPWNDMNIIVDNKIGYELHWEFIESSLENPWDRVIIVGINEIPDSYWHGTI